ncbi:zinc finger protein 598 domain containing protein, putative [Babesia caballi]|uniref:Zinc finger protein 598 domain containing protein, putative n=1 Tax=Babesia caballi TaxID=5871 RepID=A0AAV4LV27_BABCB|nr:zinc finger protein 598 domain containing protein, putative [Babesia caballi]
MNGGRRFGRESGAGSGPAPRSRAKWTASSPASLYTLFRDSLQETILEAYLQSGVARLQGVTREQLAEAAQQAAPEHFHSYLCCSICCENALVCAVGACAHVMCFLCMMRLRNFYDEDCNVYQCPYCKQDSAVLVLCANPFFAHRCTEPELYAQSGAPELTRGRLERLLRLLSDDAPVDRSLLSQEQVNIRDLQGVFLRSVAAKRDRLLQSPDAQLQRLVQKAQRLTIEKREQSEPFRDVYNMRHPRPRMDGEFVVVGEQRLLFESPSMYMLFRVVSSALCWVPECKAAWQTTEPMSTVEDLNRAVDRIYRSRHLSYEALNKHMRNKHGVVFCEVCQGHFRLKKFICEMPLYRCEDIKAHVRQGDPNRVPPIPAHVLCSACHRSQWDLAELKKHAKAEHFFCTICDADSASCDVFTDYHTLFGHFQAHHYPCEEEDCMFIVFSDDLQLQLHYMSKHPHRHRTASSRKPKPAPQAAEVPAAPRKTKTADRVHVLPSNAVAWDGNIRIVPEVEASTVAQDQPQEKAPEKPPFSAEFEEWLRSRPHLRDSQLQGVGEGKELLDAFALTLINLNLGTTAREFDFDTFSSKCATRVMSDLSRVFEMLKSGTFPPRCETWTRLPADFQDCVEQSLQQLHSEYDAMVEASIAGHSAAVGAPTLLDVVKSYVASITVFLYSINFHVEYEKLLRFVRPASVEHGVSPNALMLLNALEEMLPLTNKILVKQAFDWMVKALEGAVSAASEVQKPAATLSAMVKKKTKSGAEFSLDMLDPGRDLAKEIGQHKQQKRQQQLAKLQGRRNTAWGKGKPEEAPKVPVAGGEPSAAVSSAPEQPADPPVAAQPPEPPESLMVDSENYVTSVEEGFKKSLNVDFYSAMVSVVRQALTANESKYSAAAPGNRLRETTRMKLNQLVMSGTRRFTTLAEFVPMQTLEALQALEPEFHRLVKEAKNSALVDALAKTWSARCAYALRRCRVEHLEVIDYYLNANAAAVALRSDAEFPALGGRGAPQASGARRNYAQALNLRSSPNFVLMDSEFPALGNTRIIVPKLLAPSVQQYLPARQRALDEPVGGAGAEARVLHQQVPEPLQHLLRHRVRPARHDHQPVQQNVHHAGGELAEGVLHVHLAPRLPGVDHAHVAPEAQQPGVRQVEMVLPRAPEPDEREVPDGRAPKLGAPYRRQLLDPGLEQRLDGGEAGAGADEEHGYADPHDLPGRGPGEKVGGLPLHLAVVGRVVRHLRDAELHETRSAAPFRHEALERGVGEGARRSVVGGGRVPGDPDGGGDRGDGVHAWVVGRRDVDEHLQRQTHGIEITEDFQQAPPLVLAVPIVLRTSLHGEGGHLNQLVPVNVHGGKRGNNLHLPLRADVVQREELGKQSAQLNRPPLEGQFSPRPAFEVVGATAGELEVTVELQGITAHRAYHHGIARIVAQCSQRQLHLADVAGRVETADVARVVPAIEANDDAPDRPEMVL